MDQEVPRANSPVPWESPPPRITGQPLAPGAPGRPPRQPRLTRSACVTPFGSGSGATHELCTIKVTLSSTSPCDYRSYERTSVPEFIGNIAEELGIRLETTAVKQAEWIQPNNLQVNLASGRLEAKVDVLIWKPSNRWLRTELQNTISLPLTSETGSDITEEWHDSDASMSSDDSESKDPSPGSSPSSAVQV